MEQAERLPARAREVVEYRKSGLSLNHIQGCPLDCAYCIRHTYGLWDQRQPRALMSDDEAAESLATASRHLPRRYRTVLYWRPLVPGLNDSARHLAQAVDLSGIGDATVFTGCSS